MKSLDVGFLPVCENARLVGALTDITSCHRPQPSKSKRDVMKEREYLRLKRQIEAEYQEKIQALELIWKMAGRPGPRPER